jgi:hypothetical protein
LGISKEELDNIKIEQYPPYSDVWFAKKFFINISKEEALQINLYLKNWKTEKYSPYYYKCMLYSKKLKKCRLHTYTSRLCKGFPWYDFGIKLEEPFYDRDCGFKIDQEIQKLVNCLYDMKCKKEKCYEKS